jgi:hypothetical protein
MLDSFFLSDSLETSFKADFNLLSSSVIYKHYSNPSLWLEFKFQLLPRTEEL